MVSTFQFVINCLPPHKAVVEYMQVDSVMNDCSESQIQQRCHRWYRSTTVCKMQAVSLCTCSRFIEKTPGFSPPPCIHTER